MGLLLFLAGSASHAAIRYVGESHTSCAQSSSATSQSCTLTAPTTAGDDIVVGVAWKDTSATVASVAGSSPSSWFALYASTCNESSECVATYICHQCVAQSAITTTMTSGTAFVTSVEEYSGVQRIGITGTQTGSSSTAGLSLSTPNADSWTVCATSSLGAPNTPWPAAGAMRDAKITGTSSSHIAGAVIDNTAASAGALACSSNIVSGPWAAAGVELQSSTARTYIWPDCDTTHPCVVHHIASVAAGTASNETLQDFKFPMVASSPGNLLLLTVTHVSNKSVTVSDNNNGAWQTAVSTTNTTDGETTELHYLCGATPGTNLITIHLSQNAVHDEPLQYSYTEVSGIATSACLDGPATGANGLSGTVQPGTLNLTAAGDFVYNFGEESYKYPEYDSPIGFITPDNYSAIVMENTWDKFASQAGVIAAAGPYNPALNVNSDPNHRRWNSVAGAFFASSGAGTQPTGIHVTRILHYMNALNGTVTVPFPSTGNAIVLSTSNPSSGGWGISNLSDSAGHTYTRTHYSDATVDPQQYFTCLGTGSGGQNLAITWTPSSENTHLLIYEIAGAATTGGSTGCLGATVNTEKGNQPSSPNASITGDPVITPDAAGSVVIATSYFGTGPPSASLTPNVVFNSIWATGMVDASCWDTGDPFAYIYTTSTGPISFNWQMANSNGVSNGGSFYDGGAIEILAAPSSSDSLQPVATAEDEVATYSSSSQPVTLTATVTQSSGMVNSGTVTFTVFDGATQIGNPATSGTVSGGNASATYTLPGATIAKNYTIQAIYNPGTGQATSTDATHTLTVAKAASTIAWIPADTIIYGSAGANVLNATSTSGGGGTFNYTATPNGGSPSSIATTTTLAAGTYTITANFTPGDTTNYNNATASTSLTVSRESVWIVNGSGGTSELAGNGFGITSSPDTGANAAVALDNAGNVWSVGAGPLLKETSQVGTVQRTITSGGGLNAPLAVAIDGNGRIWVANAGNNSVSLFTNAGTALSPASGFTAAGMATPDGIAVDLSGSVWVANRQNNSVTRLLGVAAPVAPLASAAAKGMTGEKP